MAPLLVFLRIHLEHSGSAFKLWPVISPGVLSDILVNDYQALVMFFMAAVVIYIAYFPLKVFITAGIYNVIICRKGSGEEIDSASSIIEKTVSELRK